MRAVDTNVLLRFIMNDDPKQTRIAAAILRAGAYLPITVFVEAGWVLGSRFRIPRPTLAILMGEVLDLPNIVVDDESALRQAIDLFKAGADWADAIHLAAAHGSEAFVTFDRRLAKIPSPPIPIELAI